MLLRRMRYGLISDIHGNLPALEAVLADLGGRVDVAGVYHLGDLVGYGPWPDEVVALLRERGIAGVAGNYDSTTATDHEHCGCRYEDARQEELSHLSYEWTRAKVSAETKRWLGALPFRIDLRPLGGHRAGPRLILVHGNPVLNTVYWTADRSDDFCLKMAGQLGAKAGDVVAFGHTPGGGGGAGEHAARGFRRLPGDRGHAGIAAGRGSSHTEGSEALTRRA